MIKFIHRFETTANIVLFIITTGLLTYFSSKSQWMYFWISIVFCTLIYVSLQIFELKYVQGKLKLLKEKEFKYTVDGNKLGLNYFYNLQIRENHTMLLQHAQEILDKGETLKYSSLTATSLVDSNAKRLYSILKKRYLSNNRYVKVIISNPISLDKDLRNHVFRSAKNSIKLDSDLIYRIRTYLMLVGKYPNLYIKVSDFNIYCSVFMTESEGIYEPYLLSKVDSDFPNKSMAIRFKNQTTSDELISYYRMYDMHFDTLYAESIPIKEFIKGNYVKLAESINRDPNVFLKEIGL